MEEGVHQHAKDWQRRTDCRKSRLTVTEDSKAKQPKATSQKSERRNVPLALRPPSDTRHGHVLPACSFACFPVSPRTPEFSGRVLPHHWLKTWHGAGHQVGTQWAFAK